MSGRPTQGPGGLPVHGVGVSGAALDLGEPAGFEAAVRHLVTADAGLAEWVDGWQDLPRLVVILDEPARTASRAAAALALTGELVRRGHRVLLLDGDDQLPDLSRWAGRLVTEGWVDVMRYGVSLDAAARPLPGTEGHARILGVGSYQPTRATAGELGELLEILAAETDVTVVVASAGDRGAAWAVQPGLRLVCWSPADQSEHAVAAVVRDTGLLGEPPRAVLSLVGGAAVGPSRPAAATRDAASGPRSSSPVFRRLAGLLGLLIVVLVIWWTGLFDGGGPVATTSDIAGRGVDPAPVSGRAGTVPTNAPTAAETASVRTPDAAGADESAVEPELRDGDQAAAGDDPMGAGGSVTDPPAADAASGGVAADTETVVADTDPFAVAVGAAGWCLHVYSFGDSAMAREELDRMADRGVRAAVGSGVDDAGRTWYRVYAGGFPSRREARDAVPELLRRLGTDWAMPVRTVRANLR